MPARVLLALLAALSAYGIYHEGLLRENVWTAGGAREFLVFTSFYCSAVALILRRWPARLGPIVAIAAIAYAAWWAGPLAPFAVLYFLGSCYCLGRFLFRSVQGATAILAGAALWSLTLWLALHFPVNYVWVYGMAFAIPYPLWFLRGTQLRGTPETDPAEVGLSVLLFVLLAHFFVALKPEISSDGLSMHLALPAAVAEQHVWPFDHTRVIWSLMPAGADALYTGAYMLGGEVAAKLLNFAFLVLIATLLVQTARRWTDQSTAYLGAALFVSTPLVQLVTGSLFVENIWAAMLLGATLAVIDGEFALAGVLMGAAVSMKLIAVAFAIPLAAAILWFARGKTREIARAAALAALLGAPTYVFAYAKSGNPVFPFANAVFRSPDYDSEHSFVDPHYADLHPGWTTPYDITFRSARYVEGQGGAAGFQYFLLLLPAALLIRRRDQVTILAVAATATLIILIGAPNLRYLYPALPLASLAIVSTDRRWLLLGLTVVNLVFLPAAGYYDPDFALFRKSSIPAFIAAKAPVRELIDRLNRESPHEPVAFFSTDSTAGLNAPAYTDTWHNEHYWERVRNAPDAASTAAYFKSLNIRHVIAPTTREAPFEVVRTFLNRWLDPEPAGTVGVFTLYRVRDTEIPILKDTRPLTSGTHDDTEPRIEYAGAWLHDKQFVEPVNQTLSYSDVPNDSLTLTFDGPSITYIYTKAANRGIAEIRIDGKLNRRLNLYAAQTQWRSSLTISGLSNTTHTFHLRVTGSKDRKSSGNFVDLDAVEIK